MAASSTRNTTKRGTSRDRRRSGGVNRSNRRAIEIRRAETLPAHAAVAAPTADSIEGRERAARSRGGRGPAAIPRGLEMLYIRHDLRRMIFTAAALLILMLVLLVVVNAFIT